MNDKILQKALIYAYKAAQKDEVPVGAVIFNSKTNEIIACAHNQTENHQLPFAHAEIIAIKKACKKLKVKRLDGYSLFVTLEPCVMCAGAISWAHLDALYFGACDAKTGAINQGTCVFNHMQTHHKPQIFSGFEAEKCGQILSCFFKNKRQLKKNLKRNKDGNN